MRKTRNKKSHSNLHVSASYEAAGAFACPVSNSPASVVSRDHLMNSLGLGPGLNRVHSIEYLDSTLPPPWPTQPIAGLCGLRRRRILSGALTTVLSSDAAGPLRDATP